MDANKLPPSPLIAGLRGSATPTKSTPIGNGAAVDPGAIAAATDLSDFGIKPNSTALTVLVGFLGGRKQYAPDDRWWRSLFLNPALTEWVVIDEEQILEAYRANDDRCPGGSLDYIWVKSETPIGSGGLQTDPRNLFLTGGFTRAGDFATSVRGDTYSPASGLICEAITPGGCTGKSPGPR